MKYVTKSSTLKRNVSTRRAGCDRGSSLTLGKEKLAFRSVVARVRP